MTQSSTRVSAGLGVSLGSLAVIGLCLTLPGVVHAVPPQMSPQERAFDASLREVRSQLQEDGYKSQSKRLRPYREFALKQAAKGDVGPAIRSGNAARAARGYPVLPQPSGSDKSFRGWEDPKLETAPADAARAERIEARAAAKSRPVRLRVLDSHDVQIANRRAAEQSVRPARAVRAAPSSRIVRARAPASAVRNAPVARTGRVATSAARTVRVARTAQEAAEAGRVARVGAGATGAGIALVAAPEALKATTGLNVPVTEYGVRMLFTPVVAAEGGNAGKYAAEQNKWFATTVDSSSKTFVKTFRDPKQFNRNLNNYAHESAPVLKSAGCVLSTPARGVQALIAHKRMKGC